MKKFFIKTILFLIPIALLNIYALLIVPQEKYFTSPRYLLQAKYTFWFTGPFYPNRELAMPGV